MAIRDRRLVKWSDFIRRSSEGLDTMTPVFMFSEGRGCELNYETFEYVPERPTDGQLVEWIRQHVNDPGRLGRILIGDFAGRPYVAMQWKDRRYFWLAMEAFLLHGISIMPQTRLSGTWFAPEDLIRPWSPTTAEEALVSVLRRSKEEDAPGAWIQRHDGDLPHWHPNAWHTAAGKAWVADLRREAHKATESSSSDEDWSMSGLDDVAEAAPVASAEESKAAAEQQATLPTIPPVASEAVQQCVVCMEKPADTLVLPCMHQVCCRLCSNALKMTPNALKCILCRQSITDVLADKQ